MRKVKNYLIVIAILLLTSNVNAYQFEIINDGVANISQDGRMVEMSFSGESKIDVAFQVFDSWDYGTYDKYLFEVIDFDQAPTISEVPNDGFDSRLRIISEDPSGHGDLDIEIEEWLTADTEVIFTTENHLLDQYLAEQNIFFAGAEALSYSSFNSLFSEADVTTPFDNKLSFAYEIVSGNDFYRYDLGIDGEALTEFPGRNEIFYLDDALQILNLQRQDIISFELTAHFDVYASAFIMTNEYYVPPAPVPEPATMLLLGTGLVVLAGASRKKIYKK